MRGSSTLPQSEGTFTRPKRTNLIIQDPWPLDLNEAYTELSELLEETFKDYGVGAGDINTIMTIVADLKDQIVGR